MSNGDLLLAANTLWVVVAAVLVMFMQAGFAFLEAGLTRMKNAGHIAGKNVLIFGLCSLVYWAVGFGLAFGGGGSLVGTEGFFPSVGTLTACLWRTDRPALASRGAVAARQELASGVRRAHGLLRGGPGPGLPRD